MKRKTSQESRQLSFKLFFLCGLLGLVFLSCANKNENLVPLMSRDQLQSALQSDNLNGIHGEVNIYTIEDEFILREDLIFAGDAIYTPVLTLKKGNVYRVVVVFYYGDLAIGVIDADIAVGNDETQSLSLQNETIHRSYNYVEEAGVQTSINADIDAGILPNLDADDDGYSNDIERRAGSDAFNQDEIPQGPTFGRVDVNQSGNTLSLEVDVEDGIGVTSVGMSIPEASYLVDGGVVTVGLSGEIGDESREYSLSFNSQYAPVGELEIVLTATNELGLTSTKRSSVTISDSGVDGVGPIIVFDGWEANQIVSGDIDVHLQAYDRGAVTSLRLTTPNNLVDSNSASDEYFVTWQSTSQLDGLFHLVAEAEDEQGNRTTRRFPVSVQNGGDGYGPTFQVSFYKPESTSQEIDYLNGESVYGITRMVVTASDPSSVTDLYLDNESALGCGPDNYTSCPFTDQTSSGFSAQGPSLRNYLDVTDYADGEEITLEFYASDEPGNIRSQSFTVTTPPSTK